MHPMLPFPPPLVDAYREGKLAILFGSGLSLAKDVQGDFPRWSDLPTRLLEQATKQGALTQSRAEAVRNLVQTGPSSLAEMLTTLDLIKTPLRGAREYRAALTAVFRPKNAAPGDIHRAIVELGVNVLLTTNYDELLELVEGPPARRAYSWRQSDKALADLNDGRKVLFKIHGDAADDDSVVMTHAEYADASTDTAYQRTMSLLLQTYTFLLIGYGVNDPLDLDLVFRLNASAFGAAARRHYALIKDANPNDRDRWQREMNVQVVPYDDHAALPSIVRGLRESKSAALGAPTDAQPIIASGDRAQPPGGPPADSRSPDANTPARAPAVRVPLRVSSALDVKHRRDQTASEYHHYKLTMNFKNIGRTRIDDWQIVLEFPTRFLDAFVRGGIAEGRKTRFVWDGRKLDRPIYPGETDSVDIGYQVRDSDFWEDREDNSVFDQKYVVQLLVNGVIEHRETKPFRDIQEF